MFPRGWYIVHAGPGLDRGSERTADLLGGRMTIARSARGIATVTDDSGRQLPAYETAGAVFAWWGEQVPTWRPGPFPELDDTRHWTEVHWLPSGAVRTTVQNAQRDVVDNAHFGPVHGLRRADTRAHPAGHAFDTVSQGVLTLRRLGGPPLLAHVYLDGRLHGPGLLVYYTTITIGIEIHNMLFSAVTPVDEEHSVFFAGASVRKLPVPGLNRFMIKTVAKGFLLDYEADAKYWAGGRVRPAEAGELTDDDVRMYAMFDEWMAQYLVASPAAAAAS